jgi:hypothetical protein
LALSPSAAANRRIGLLKFKPEITPLSIPTNFAPLPCPIIEDGDVLSFDKTKFLQALVECGD